MKFWLFPTLAVALSAVGCTPAPEEAVAPTAPVQAQPASLTPEEELAKFCRVCVVDNGEKIEEYFPSRLDTEHGGQTYKLCSDNCKKKFDANPQRYALK